MSEASFRQLRRQKFLTLQYFDLNRAYCENELVENAKAIASGSITAGDSAYAGVPGSSFKNALKLVRLHYTAGAPIESLEPLFDRALHWFDEWHRSHRQHVQALAAESGDDLRDDGSPLPFEDLFHFQLGLDLVSLGTLLGKGDAVRRAAGWLQRYRGTDMLFEAIVERAVTDPRDIEEFFHEEPYGLLIDAMYTADTPEEASACVKRYLDGWYQAFDGVPWHNGHLVTTAEYSDYEGYWAFEAAAVCVIHGIDDSSFRDHLVYPKDLADWARRQHVLDRIGPDAGQSAFPLRCAAGQPCPRSGWWSTPAAADSRRRFQAGDLMPELHADYGVTIWQWDAGQ